MKKIFAVLLSVCLCLTVLSGCGAPQSPPPKAQPVSIELSGMKTAFILGERFASTGLKVTLTLSDGTTRAALSGDYIVDSSAYNAAAVGTYTIVVTLKGTAITAAYTVTVSKRPAADPEEPDGPDAKSIDLWVLAGQSNAAGYSNVTQLAPSGKTYDALLEEADPRTAAGYETVKYYGLTDVPAALPLDLSAAGPFRTAIGLGRTPDFIGPELGMADALADRDTPSAIVKFAAGGTFLCDFGAVTNESQTYGNWASPSMIEAAKTRGETVDEKRTGLLYQRLLQVLTSAVAAFSSEGYAVKVKGYVWMQGEADAGRNEFAAVYEQNLKLFIADLRAAAADITGHPQAETRPFVLGLISPSGGYGSFIRDVRLAQTAAAAPAQNVYTVETSDLPISSNGTVTGSDAWHFNALDMFTLGQRFAATALEHSSAA